MTLPVTFQEVGNAPDRLAQIVFMREENEPEVIWIRPVEARPLHQQDTFFTQKFGDERLIILDRIHRGVEPGEHVERRLGFDAAHARNRGNQFMREVALTIQAPGRRDQIVNTLIATQRSLNAVLAGTLAHRRIEASMSRPSM